jgi:hypothetical protein
MVISSSNRCCIGYPSMIMTAIGIILLVLNVAIVVNDIKKNTITKVTLLNAAAVGSILTTLTWIS